MTLTVNAHVPLSLLEAVRTVDHPKDDSDTEIVPELRNKRLGLTDTVYTQIRRYAEAARRNQRIAFDEAAGIARLIGRRPDALAVFLAGGRHLAEQAYRSIAAPTRGLIESLPAVVARPIALRQARRVTERFLDGSLRRGGSSVTLAIAHSPTADGASPGVGCAFYEAFLVELLRMLGVGGHDVEHVRCVARRDTACEWRTEWRVAPDAASAQRMSA